MLVTYCHVDEGLGQKNVEDIDSLPVASDFCVLVFIYLREVESILFKNMGGGLPWKLL
jgi:hypothetical protein